MSSLSTSVFVSVGSGRLFCSFLRPSRDFFISSDFLSKFSLGFVPEFRLFSPQRPEISERTNEARVCLCECVFVCVFVIREKEEEK